MCTCGCSCYALQLSCMHTATRCYTSFNTAILLSPKRHFVKDSDEHDYKESAHIVICKMCDRAWGPLMLAHCAHSFFFGTFLALFYFFRKVFPTNVSLCTHLNSNNHFNWNNTFIRKRIVFGFTGQVCMCTIVSAGPYTVLRLGGLFCSQSETHHIDNM